MSSSSRQDGPTDRKVPYHTPKLEEYGSVRELTAAGTGDVAEPGMAGGKAMGGPAGNVHQKL